MRPADHWSDRRSGGVELPRPKPHVGRPDETAAAPESLPLSLSSAAGVGRAARRAVRRLERVDHDLSQRERAVLESLAALRFLSTGQLQRLHFTDHASEGAASRICRRVLKRLCDLGVIEHLQRRMGGIRAGSASFVWRVGPVGDRLLRQAAGQGARRRRKEPSLRYLDHCLTIAACYLQLVEAARSGRLELISHQTEPSCWRPYLGPQGAAEILKPDLYAVTAEDDYEDSWFIEIDRGSESLPTVLRKCDQYERYRLSGQEQAARGVFPVVLWVVPDEVRRQRLLTGLRQAPRLDRQLFRVTTTAQFSEAIAGGAT